MGELTKIITTRQEQIFKDIEKNTLAKMKSEYPDMPKEEIEALTKVLIAHLLVEGQII